MTDSVRHRDPITWFHEVFAEAGRSETFDPSRAALATVDSVGRPSVRFVLVKLVEEAGFCFFTNHESDKGSHLRGRPEAALAFHWSTIGIQVRVEGSVERMTDEESDEYFGTRPRGSQLAAWASEQSRPIGSREELESRFEAMQERFADTAVPRPDFWGGYRIVPRRIEFWNSRESRLHDRWSFARAPEGWSVKRLQP